jgi:hypothetical protein
VYQTFLLAALAPLLLLHHSLNIPPKSGPSTIILLSQYMTSSPRQAGTPPAHAEYRNRTSTSTAPSITRDVRSDWIENFMSLDQDLEPSHPNPQNQRFGFTNNGSQYQGLHRNDFNSHAAQGCELLSPFAARTEHDLLGGMANYAAQSGSSTHNAQVGVGQTEFSRDTSSSRHIPPHAMQSTPQIYMDHTAPSDQPTLALQTKYEPFQHRFHTSEEARNHRRRATRFDRTPYCDPFSDLTIADIEKNRLQHVMRIYNAMTSGESAKDNRGSIAMKRWVLDAHYPPDLVESYAHKLFDCLLLQAKEGFRGWVHNDYVADERKGDDIDKDVDCAARLDNIILALEQEKTICEDVMNSACQIRMFVNAPRAYANRKHQNRVGNSKRGRTKDTPDTNPGSAKRPKTSGRHTRARSSTAASDLPSCRGTTPQQQQPPLQLPLPPYYPSSSQPQSLLKTSANSYPPPESTHFQRPTLSAPLYSYGPRSVVAMSPPTSSPRSPLAPQLHTPRMTTEILHRQPFLPPSPLYNNYSAPASPEDTKPAIVRAPLENWHGGFAEDLYTHSAPAVDPALPLWDEFPRPTPCEGDGEMNQRAGEFVNLSDIERPHAEHDGSAGDGSFGDFWNMGPGAQDFGPH